MRRRLAEITHSLAMMELVKLVIIVLLLLTSVFCQEMEVDNWREGIEENKWPNSGEIQDIFVRMSRNPGSQHYLRVIGKDSAKSQRSRKRNRFQTFVGLMGKRSFEDQGAM
ncbi:protachykinin [Sparus aurata]|uniref:protachykinin n=1 Tax=Sparus aurata TaxID=8175 RepID=UPI0011C19FCF|nr:protachykinin-like [Sparus aurata]